MTDTATHAPEGLPATPAPVRLTPAAARVLGTLMEKARTVPDSYPLTLNTLLQGCNQKTSREPIMELTEADVALALDDLRGLSLVHEVSGSRTAKFTHNMQRGLGVYELLCRSPLGRRPRLFGAVWFLALTAAAWGLTRLFSDRGVFIHVGAC